MEVCKSLSVVICFLQGPDNHLLNIVCISGFVSTARKLTPPHTMTVPLDPRAHLNPEHVLKASLGSARILGMAPEVRPDVKGGCYLLAHSWQHFLGYFSCVETVLRQIWGGRAMQSLGECEMLLHSLYNLSSTYFSHRVLILPCCYLFSRLCSSYPQKLLVPVWITDKELENVASFRSWKRIPVVVYR